MLNVVRYLFQKFPYFPISNNHNLKEYTNFELSFGGEICNFISLYHYITIPSQSSDTIEDLQIISNLIQKRSQGKAHVYYSSLVISMLNHEIGINMIKQLMKVKQLIQ